MTPYYYKTSQKDQDKLNNVDNLLVSAEFRITVYKKRCHSEERNDEESY